VRVLLVHNYYRQAGGEEQVFAAEGALLEREGHEVSRWTVHSADAEGRSRVALAREAVWSSSSVSRLAAAIRARRPDVVHFHNTFPLISPAAYSVVRAAGIPVVQTLHNYRLICPRAILHRAGGICEECVGRAPLPAVVHACCRDSRAVSAVTAGMLMFHRARGTWERDVDRYIALTEFARGRFIAGGLPADRIVVKPHFVAEDPGVGTHDGGYCLFVGRLAAEKGVETLLSAWRELGSRIPLRVAGDGPLAGAVRDAPAGVSWEGRVSRDRLFELMRDAAVLVVPSVTYETFGLAVIEAYAAGLPVVASDIGAVGELVEEGVTGVKFAAGDARDLVRAATRLLERPGLLREMSVRAREAYEARYTAQCNYEMLRDIYESVRR
jgi:glycosyltransferase involved in cell wall biosynthesis